MSLISHGGEITLSLPRNKFGEFIVDLLSNQQIIEGKSFRTFTIRHEDIENFFLLVDQRIKAQNKIEGYTFSVVYNYNDGSRIELNSYESFIKYHETRPVICTKVILSLILLITFPDKEIPEKQSIDIEFNVATDESDVPNFVLDISGITKPRQRLINKGMIKYRIEHTSVFWGNDIENIIKNKIENISNERSKYFEFIMRNENVIDAIAHISHYILILLSSYFILFELDVFDVFLGKVVEYSLSKTSMIVVSCLIFVLTTKYIFTQIYFSLFWLINSIEKNDSFIPITDEGKKYQEKELKKKKRKNIVFVFTSALNVCLSIVANILFAYIFAL